MKLRITCVHQGFELYGSDRSFIECVETLRSRYPQADITIVLPQDGPIVPLLAVPATRIIFEPLWVLRKRGILRLATLGLLRLPAALARAVARFRASDLVYINTTVVLDYSLAARAFPGRALIHAHELPNGLVRTVLRAILRFSRADLIFNSKATRAGYLPVGPGVSTHVVYNGIAGPARPEPMTYAGERPLRLLMLGRISRNKGQAVLVAALAALPLEIRSRVEVRIVGSVFGDDTQTAELTIQIRDADLDDTITMLPFTADPSDMYRWADIVAVPTCLHESLGRVAIEGLAFGRPPLVSDLGGLPEIVEDGVGGWLVPPGNVAALAARLQQIILDPAGWATFPEAGRTRYDAMFSRAVVSDAFAEVVARTFARSGSRPSGPAAPALAKDRA